jgi:hypothetical protein
LSNYQTRTQAKIFYAIDIFKLRQWHVFCLLISSKVSKKIKRGKQNEAKKSARKSFQTFEPERDLVFLAHP